jgi:hypothetical protein
MACKGDGTVALTTRHTGKEAHLRDNLTLDQKRLRSAARGPSTC